MEKILKVNTTLENRKKGQKSVLYLQFQIFSIFGHCVQREVVGC